MPAADLLRIAPAWFGDEQLGALLAKPEVIDMTRRLREVPETPRRLRSALSEPREDSQLLACREDTGLWPRVLLAVAEREEVDLRSPASLQVSELTPTERALRGLAFAVWQPDDDALYALTGVASIEEEAATPPGTADALTWIALQEQVAEITSDVTAEIQRLDAEIAGTSEEVSRLQSLVSSLEADRARLYADRTETLGSTVRAWAAVQRVTLLHAFEAAGQPGSATPDRLAEVLEELDGLLASRDGVLAAAQGRARAVIETQLDGLIESLVAERALLEAEVAEAEVELPIAIATATESGAVILLSLAEPGDGDAWSPIGRALSRWPGARSGEVDGISLGIQWTPELAPGLEELTAALADPTATCRTPHVRIEVADASSLLGAALAAWALAVGEADLGPAPSG